MGVGKVLRSCEMSASQSVWGWEQLIEKANAPTSVGMQHGRGFAGCAVIPCNPRQFRFLMNSASGTHLLLYCVV